MSDMSNCYFPQALRSPPNIQPYHSALLPRALATQPTCPPVPHGTLSREMNFDAHLVERGSHVFTPSSNFPTLALPIPRAHSYSAHGAFASPDVKKHIQGEKWDWGIRTLDMPHLTAQTDIEVRRLNFYPIQWTQWEPAKVLHVFTQRSFLGAEYTVYYAQVKAGHTVVVVPILGEVRTKDKQPALQSPTEAVQIMNRLSQVYVRPPMASQSGKQVVWYPARIKSKLNEPTITVELAPGVRSSPFKTHEFVADCVLPYSPQVAQALREFGHTVDSSSGF